MLHDVDRYLFCFSPVLITSPLGWKSNYKLHTLEQRFPAMPQPEKPCLSNSLPESLGIAALEGMLDHFRYGDAGPFRGALGY